MECAVVQSVLDETAYSVDNELPPLIEDEEDMTDSSSKINDLSNRVGVLERNSVADSQFDALATRFSAVESSLEAITASVIRPSGSIRVFRKLRDWGVLAACITIFVTCIGFLLGAVYLVVHRVGDEATFQTKTDMRLTSIEKSLANLRLSSLSVEPVTPHVVEQIRQIIGDANSSTQALDPLVVSDAAQQFIKQSTDNPSAWQAATLLVGYRSNLNEASAPNLPPEIEHFGKTTYEYPPAWTGKLSWTGRSHFPDLPQMHQMDRPDTNPSNPLGPSYLLMNGGTVPLDNLFLKRVIIANATVVFHGGPLHLEGIYFVNCRFEITSQHSGQLLAFAILADPAVSFSA
jgi:hypothetical protein